MRERKADTSSEEEYFDAGQLSGVWEGLKGLWEDVREGAAAGRLPLPAQGTNMSFPSLKTNGIFLVLGKKQSDKNKRNGETEESYRNRKAGSLGVRSALLFITESDRYRRHLSCDGRATVQLMAAEY